jgi:hypothetical protein
MTPTLGQRIKATSKFRWMPGMLFRHEYGVMRLVSSDEACPESGYDTLRRVVVEPHHVPDLDDRTTLQLCLWRLEQVIGRPVYTDTNERGDWVVWAVKDNLRGFIEGMNVPAESEELAVVWAFECLDKL